MEGKVAMAINSLISKMTIAEKVGQLVQVGFTGVELNSEITDLINNYHIGGIIYFRRNLKSQAQVKDLSEKLQQLALRKSPPLFIAVDEEGGTVVRLSDGVHFPGAMALGATKDLKLIEQVAQAKGQELKAVGINFNLAPVLDVNNNDANPVIGVRAFSDKPQEVAKFGVAFMRGLQKAGIISCGKHFPGHGDTALDSHDIMPVIKHDLPHLRIGELIPFKAAIAQGLDSIMTAHIYFKALAEEKNLPATLSQSILTGLLRNEMNFKGLIITDCMEMKAISGNFDLTAASVKAILAGSDQILISHTYSEQKKALTAIKNAVLQGQISEKRIDESLKRILNLKVQRIGTKLKSNYTPEYSRQNSEKLAKIVAEKGISAVGNYQKLLPWPKDKEINLIEFANQKRTAVESQADETTLLAEKLMQKGYQITQVGSGKVVVLKNASFDSAQQKFITNLKEKVLFLIMGNPYDLKLLSPDAIALICYDHSPYSIDALISGITGEIAINNQLSIEL